MSKDLCFICGMKADIEFTQNIGDTQRLGYYVKCPRCGIYQLDNNDEKYIKDQIKSEVDVAILSHTMRTMQKNDEIPWLSQGNITGFLRESLPSASEQKNNFVLWLGDSTSHLGVEIAEDASVIQAEIGAINIEGVRAITKDLKEKRLIESSNMAGAFESASTLILMLTSGGWEFYEKIKHANEISKLLKFLINSPSSPHGQPEIIMKELAWREDKFQDIYQTLKFMGLIDSQYADNKIFDIWVTEKGRLAAVPNNFQLLLTQVNAVNTYNQYGDTYSVSNSGNEINVALGPGASVSKGLNSSEIKQLFEVVFRQIEQQPVSPTVKQEIQDAAELVQDEVVKGEKANEKALATFFRTLQKMAPDILDVIISTATNPALGASTVVRKVAEKIKREAK